MGEHIIRTDLKSEVGKIIVIRGLYLYDDERTKEKLPLFVNVINVDTKKKIKGRHIHIKRENIINDDILIPKKYYMMIGTIEPYHYEDGTENYTLNYTILMVD